MIGLGSDKNSPTCLFWLQVVVAPTCPVWGGLAEAFFLGGGAFSRGQLKEIALYKNVLLSLLCILPKCRRHVGGEERRGTYWLELYN